MPHFDVASNPEFLQEGRAVENFFKPDRIVIGVESERARELLESIYRPLQCPIVVTNLTTSELIKHAANAFLSTKISFINMVSDMCESVGADVVKVAKGIGLDPRIGTRVPERRDWIRRILFPERFARFRLSRRGARGGLRPVAGSRANQRPPHRDSS